MVRTHIFIMSQIKSRIRFVFVQNMKMRKSELCFIKSDFNGFEDMIKEKVIERFFLSYQQKLIPYLGKLFYAKKLQSVVFLMMSTST